MHEYDIALKALLQTAADPLLRQITGNSVVRWLNVEIPLVSSSRVDLLGAAADDTLIHIELQSSNDGEMGLRMAEYCLRIYRQFGKFPRQIVLYVGERELSMKSRLSGPNCSFEYTLMDVRELDGRLLLASERVEDSFLAILTRLDDQRGAILEILSRIGRLEGSARRDALAKFLIISGLRRLTQTITKEAHRMPILDDIMDNEVFGPKILQGRREALHQQLVKRFSPIPDWVETRLASLSRAELENLTNDILDAPSLEDLFPQKH